jgi:hypothetical protein
MFKITFFLVFIGIQFLSAQSVELDLISSAGQDHNSTDLDVQWSVGESVIGPFDSTANPTTHGFEQLIFQEVMGVVDRLNEDMPEVSLRKNPNYVRLLFGNTEYAFEVRLFNSKGQSLKRFSTSRGQETLDIPMQYFSKSVVFMNVYTKQDKLVKTYKLIRGEH